MLMVMRHENMRAHHNRTLVAVTRRALGTALLGGSARDVTDWFHGSAAFTVAELASEAALTGAAALAVAQRLGRRRRRRGGAAFTVA